MSQRLLPAALLMTLSALALSLAPQRAQADPPIDEAVWVICKPVESMIHHGSRFFVRCEEGWTHPSTGKEYNYYAISTANSTYVQQSMSMAHTAQISGKRLRLRIKTSASANPNGCNTNDCRFFTAIGVVN